MTPPTLWERVSRGVAGFLVIVIGVLAALAVDQWWQDQEDSRLTTFYLAALEDDLVADSTWLDETAIRARAVGEAAARLEGLVHSSGQPSDTIGFRNDLVSLLFTFTFEPNSATFDDITSSGNWRLLQNHELRNRLQRYAVAVERASAVLAENGRGVGRNSFPVELLRSPVFDWLRDRLQGDPLTDLDSSRVLEALRSDPESVGEWLRRRQLHTAFVVGQLTVMLEGRTIPMIVDVRNERSGRPLAVRD